MPNQALPVVVIGAGPAGLMAAEVLSSAGVPVEVFDAMPTAGRKFLLAGIGGLNLTHSEPFTPFAARYAGRRAALEPLLQAFDAEAVRGWARSLGVETFVGSSGRVFPADMKAAPLLRAWLHRLRAQGVRCRMWKRWLGWAGDDAAPSCPALRFASPAGGLAVRAENVVLALGGASWSKLGSDGAWVPLLASRGVDVAPLRPSNCGFDVGWSEHFAARFAGAPLKSVAIEWLAADGQRLRQAGEFVVTLSGVEGSLVYAASAGLRDRIASDGEASFWLDLLPDRPAEWVAREVAHPRGTRSLSTHLKTRLNLAGVKAGLLWERLPKEATADPARLATAIKALPITLRAPRPIDEAISSAGGVRFEAMDAGLMLKAMPGVFCAGEMLDWEAPTGGYLLTACLASGRAAGRGVLRRLGQGQGGQGGHGA
jgi:uncharacterized flavoprotein (TIGR03862 family)